MKETKKDKDIRTEDNISAGELAGDFVFTFLLTFFLIIAVALVGFKLMGFNILTVDSGSMEPVYGVDSLIFVKKAEPETIVNNDIVTYVFNEDGDLVTHRVVGIDRMNRTFTTKGDANDLPDSEPVLWDNVVGKVVFGVPKVGAAFREITAPENRTKVIAIIVVLVTVTVVGEIAGSVREKKKRSEKAE